MPRRYWVAGRRKNSAAPRTGERGVALVVVLWVSLLLAAIAGGFIVDARTSTRIARNAVDNSVAQALADGGVHQAVFALLHPDPERRWKRDGRNYRVAVEGGRLDIAVRDEAGKIDINRADGELLEGLLLAAAVPEELIRAILDTLSDSPRGGVGGGDAAGDQGPLQAVDALRQMPGVSALSFRKLRPAITVFGEDARLSLETAPRLALLAIPGVTEDEVDLFLRSRQQDLLDVAMERFLEVGRAREFQRRRGGRFVTIAVLATAANGAQASRRAIVELIGAPDRPFIIREWRADPDRDAEAPPADPDAAEGGA